MNVTATPIAILISGILIFYGLLLVSNSQDEYYYYLEERTHANDTNRVVANNIDFGHNLWSCAERNNQDD